MTTAGSFKTEVLVDGEWVSNALRFTTDIEAKHYGDDLLSCWMAAKEMRVTPSTEAPTHQFANGRLAVLS